MYSTLTSRRHHHAGELDLADAERPAAAGGAKPAQEETRHLPQGIEAEAARHHRIALEVAFEEPIEPVVAGHLELGGDLALAVQAAGLGNERDAVEHQHWRQRQLGVAGAEKLAASARKKILEFEARAAFCHDPSSESSFGAQRLWRLCRSRGFLTQSIGLQKGAPAGNGDAVTRSRARVELQAFRLLPIVYVWSSA